MIHGAGARGSGARAHLDGDPAAPRPAGARPYRLTAPDGTLQPSDTPGELGGNRRLRIYGRLDCRSARAALPRGYAAHRAFFADEAAAIAAGYRPCATCMPARYAEWKRGGAPGSAAYPWLIAPMPRPAERRSRG